MGWLATAGFEGVGRRGRRRMQKALRWSRVEHAAASRPRRGMDWWTDSLACRRHRFCAGVRALLAMQGTMDTATGHGGGVEMHGNGQALVHGRGREHLCVHVDGNV